MLLPFGITIIIVALLATIPHQILAEAIIDPALQQMLSSGEKPDLMVSFASGTEAVINEFNSMAATTFSSGEERRAALTSAQEWHAASEQAPLQTLLIMLGVPFETFWISNKMSIKGADERLVNVIAGFRGVASIGQDQEFTIIDPPDSSNETETAAVGGVGSEIEAAVTQNAEWGIKKIKADQLWNKYNGAGVVVANIDSGVRHTHESLKARWRTSHGWYDPYTLTSLPFDNDGHGTHTMGTITGSNGIGVAPGATWIACKGCDMKTCRDSMLQKCGQWIQCPTLPDGKSSKNCAMAPHVVNYSLGSFRGNKDYLPIINSWKAAGILAVFAIGNNGNSGCSSAQSPGDLAEALGVGCTDDKDRIVNYSSKGPSTTGTLKPDIVAPGNKIRSASHSSDTGYATLSGTSMAAPHVTGLVALMLQKKKGLSHATVYNILTKTAVSSELDTSYARECGGKPPTTFPNNEFGYGRVDAAKALNAVK